MKELIDQFTLAAENVGAIVHPIEDITAVAEYITRQVDGPVLVTSCPSLSRTNLNKALQNSNVCIQTSNYREHGASAVAGVTGANFGIAATGTVVLESTDESIRIATTLPDKHFVLLDPQKILKNADEAVSLLNDFHNKLPQAYMAYITGPSRTADIERVLTIGVHGPAELHILLLDGLSDDLMER